MAIVALQCGILPSYCQTAQQTHTVAPVRNLDFRNQGTTLARAHISDRFRKRILSDLCGGCTDLSLSEMSGEESSRLYIADLSVAPGAPKRRAIRVLGGDQTCGTTGNCPILLYDAHTERLILGDSGFDFNFLRIEHAGVHDIAVWKQGGGPCNLWETFYRFDGTRFVEVRSAQAHASCKDGLD
jgi:hypothetical protein